MLIAVPLIITMAVGLVLGLRLASERETSLKLSSHGGQSRGHGWCRHPVSRGDGDSRHAAADMTAPIGHDGPAPETKPHQPALPGTTPACRLHVGRRRR
jgi:hypothetical protein